MKKVLFAVLLLIAVDGYAQIGFGIGGGGMGMGMRVPLGGGGNSGKQQGRNIEKQVQRMKRDLKLTDDQMLKVRSLLVERERRRNSSNPMASREFNDRLKDILTPEQFAILKEKRQEKHQQKGQQIPSQNDSIKQSSASDKEDDWDDVYH